jgi:hypothetical protein
MKIKPTNAYNHLRIHDFTNVANIQHVHVSATLVAILREVLCKVFVTKPSNPNSTDMSNIKF